MNSVNASVRSWEKRPSWPWFLGASGGPTQVLESQKSQNIIKKDLKHSKTCQKLCIYIYICIYYIYFFSLQKSRQLLLLTFLRCEAVVVSTWEVRPSTRWIQDSVPQPQTRKGAKQGGPENSKTAKPMKLYEMMS